MYLKYSNKTQVTLNSLLPYITEAGSGVNYIMHRRDLQSSLKTVYHNPSHQVTSMLCTGRNFCQLCVTRKWEVKGR